jgi:hypothetical protein
VNAEGWFPDPERPGRLRYFDGTHWTDQDAEHAPTAPVGPAIGDGEPASDTLGMYQKLGFVLLAVVIGAFVWFAWFALTGNDDSDDKPASPDRTAVDVACAMLDEGETVRSTYDVLVDVLEPSYTGDGHKTAADAAVAQAQAQGCG